MWVTSPRVYPDGSQGANDDLGIIVKRCYIYYTNVDALDKMLKRVEHGKKKYVIPNQVLNLFQDLTDFGTWKKAYISENLPSPLFAKEG